MITIEKGTYMATRIQPLQPGESSDPAVNELLQQGREGWWGDSAMFGVIGRNPELLKSIVPVFGAFFRPRSGGAAHPRVDALKDGAD